MESEKNESCRQFFLEKLQELSENPFVKKRQEWLAYGERLRQRLEDKSFRIAVVGEFSSGKSTFINALVQQDLLSHATQETTAVLTRLVNVQKDDPRCRTGKIYWKDGREELLSDLGRLTDYTTKDCRAASQVDGVDVFVPIIEGEEDFTIVDTPGLNGLAEGLREKTERMVQEAHACIYLLPERGLSQSDVTFLEQLIRYQRQFIFVQNFMDCFYEEEGMTFERRKAEITHTLQKLEAKEAAEGCRFQYAICGVSALYELAKYESNAVIAGGGTARADHRFRQDTGFTELRRLLMQMLQQAQDIQYRATGQAVCDWCGEMLRLAEQLHAQAVEAYEASAEKGAADRLEKRRQKILEQRSREEEALKGFIQRFCREAQSDADEEFHRKMKALEEEFRQKIDGVASVQELEEQQKNIADLLNDRVQKDYEETGNYLNRKFAVLYQLILQRIEEYTGMCQERLKLETIDMGKLPQNEWKEQDYFHVSRLEMKLQQCQAEWEDGQRALASLGREIDEAERDDCEVACQLEEVREIRDRQLDGLGYRPEVEYRTETYTTRERSWIFFHKNVTHTRTIRDDSAQKNWDRRRAEIENRYTEQREEFLDRQSRTQRELRRLKRNRNTQAENVAALEEELEDVKKGLARARELKREAEEKARRDYLRLCKQQRKQELEVFLFGTDDGASCICDDSHQQLEQAILSAEKNLVALTLQKFNESLQKKLSWIEAAKQKENPKLAQAMVSSQQEMEMLREKYQEMEQRAS